MTITDIQPQKHRKNRFSVFIDNEFAFGIDGVDLLYYKLNSGEEITEEKYNNIIENAVYTKCRDKAARLLAHSPKTKKELLQRLEKEDYPSNIIEKVIRLMEEYGYIDDESYARAYIKDKFELKGYGRKKLQYELQIKGVPKDVTEKILEEFDFDESEKALSLLISKYGEVRSPDMKTKQKMYGYLLRRGYTYDVISECFSKLETE